MISPGEIADTGPVAGSLIHPFWSFGGFTSFDDGGMTLMGNVDWRAQSANPRR